MVEIWHEKGFLQKISDKMWTSEFFYDFRDKKRTFEVFSNIRISDKKLTKFDSFKRNLVGDFFGNYFVWNENSSVTTIKFLWNSLPTNSEGSFSEVVNENIVCYHRKIEPIDNNAKCDENLIGHTIIIDKGLKLKIV